MKRLIQVKLFLLCAIAVIFASVSFLAPKLLPKAPDFDISLETIKSFAPKGDAALLSAIAENLDRLAHYEINTHTRMAHFMAQIAHESSGFKRLDENMNYSASRLRAVFPNRVTQAEAETLARHPQAIANHVYGDRLGNRGRDTDAGWNYRGSGYIQLTGRDNFLKYGKLIEQDIAGNPDLSRTASVALETAAAFWHSNGLNEAADQNDLCTIRKRINGGLHGVDETRQWLQRATLLFDTDPARVTSPDGIDHTKDHKAIADMLLERGVEIALGEEDVEVIKAALAAYQKARGLEQTGLFDIHTLHAVSDDFEISSVPDKCP